MELAGARILVTGGTGSFGHHVATRLLGHRPREIRILSRDEKKQWEMQRLFPDFTYVIGDVRDEAQLDFAMRNVDFVFHAAALKQVPSCELYPYEAFKTNTVGSVNACAAARRNGVRTFVALSTDKAVKPVNAMGLSKAMMEKIVCSQNLLPGETTFCCVRYGNVIGSRGSVVPLFRSLIKARQPLTLTVPHMTRFLLTLDESVELVVQAMTTARGGEIFVRKAPACTVEVLARAMAARYSELGEAHPIEIVGMRPGEKIHEVLVNEYEMQHVVELQDYFVIHPEYRLPPTLTPQPEGMEYTSENTRRLEGHAEVTRLLEAADAAAAYG